MDKWLNGGVDEEWTDPDAPPHFDNIREGLEDLEKPIDDELLREMYEKAAKHIEENKQDPTQQNYLQRRDTNSLIKTEAEYNWCLQNRVSMKAVPYGMAVEILKLEDAQKRRDAAKKQKRKSAKKARQKNR